MFCWAPSKEFEENHENMGLGLECVDIPFMQEAYKTSATFARKVFGCLLKILGGHIVFLHPWKSS